LQPFALADSRTLEKFEVETIPITPFTGDSWETLPERVKEAYELLQETLREYGDPEDIECDQGLYRHVKHLFWLVPLAEALRQRTELQGLYPLMHHAVIELKRLPHSVPQEESFTFFAEADGLFLLSLDQWQPSPITRHSQELGRGSAQQVTELLIRIVQNTENLQNDCSLNEDKQIGSG
jgi:hypothetical protein